MLHAEVNSMRTEFLLGTGAARAWKPSGEGDIRHSRNAARGRTACLIAHDMSHSAQYYARK
jgi:hypothetical protein